MQEKLLQIRRIKSTQWKVLGPIRTILKISLMAPLQYSNEPKKVKWWNQFYSLSLEELNIIAWCQWKDKRLLFSRSFSVMWARRDFWMSASDDNVVGAVCVVTRSNRGIFWGRRNDVVIKRIPLDVRDWTSMTTHSWCVHISSSHLCTHTDTHANS